MLADFLIDHLSYNSPNLGSFSDFSSFPYILGPTAEPLLGSQGAVI